MNDIVIGQVSSTYRHGMIEHPLIYIEWREERGVDHTHFMTVPPIKIVEAYKAGVFSCNYASEMKSLQKRSEEWEMLREESRRLTTIIRELEDIIREKSEIIDKIKTVMGMK